MGNPHSGNTHLDFLKSATEHCKQLEDHKKSGTHFGHFSSGSFNPTLRQEGKPCPFGEKFGCPGGRMV